MFLQLFVLETLATFQSIKCYIQLSPNGTWVVFYLFTVEALHAVIRQNY